MYFRIEYPAYVDRNGVERPANALHVVGIASRDKHIAQITNAGGANFTVTELTAAEYCAVAFAKLGR